MSPTTPSGLARCDSFLLPGHARAVRTSATAVESTWVLVTPLFAMA
jgi:hypothetical protein